MSDLEIERVQVYAVGPETTRYTWASDMDDQFMTHNLIRITAHSGLEGIAAAASYTDHGFDRSVVETLRPLLPSLLGVSALAREHLWYRLQSHNLPAAPQALSMIDIALWDLVAKQAGLPLYQLLGGCAFHLLRPPRSH